MKSYLLPKGFFARPATVDDLEGVVEMINACSRELIGVDITNPSDFLLEWETPVFNLETDTCLVIAPGGQIAGYYDVWDLDNPHVMVQCWGRVHPQYTGCGIGSYLLDWSEHRARQAISKAPEDARVVLQSFALSIDLKAGDLIRQAGFNLIRHSWRMVIELDGQPPQPQWPTGIRVRNFTPGQEERAVLHAVRDSFKDHWGYVEHPFEEEFERWNHFIKDSEEFDPTLWFLAVEGDEIAGVSLCRPKINDDPDMGWVGTLGVRRPWRRLGLGLALLQHSFNEFYRRGNRKVGLGVDAQNLTGATRLYQKAGMHADPARQFDLFEKELRPGKDMRTQTVEA
jgi:mycothiol synthase